MTLQSSRHIGYFVVRQKIKEWKWSIVRRTYQRSGISTSGRRSPPPFPRWRLWVGSGVSVQIVPRWRPGAAGWRSRNCRDRPDQGVPAGWGREAGWQEPDIVARSWGLAPPRQLQRRRTWAEPTAWGDPGVTLAAAVVVVVAAAQTLCPQPRPDIIHPASPRISAQDLVREVEAEKWSFRRRCAASVLTCFIAICTDTNLREHPGLQMIPSEYFLVCCCLLHVKGSLCYSPRKCMWQHASWLQLRVLFSFENTNCHFETPFCFSWIYTEKLANTAWIGQVGISGLVEETVYTGLSLN